MAIFVDQTTLKAYNTETGQYLGEGHDAHPGALEDQADDGDDPTDEDRAQAEKFRSMQAHPSADWFGAILASIQALTKIVERMSDLQAEMREERGSRPPGTGDRNPSSDHPTITRIRALLKEHAGALHGRLSAQEVARLIGFNLTMPDRRAFGVALSEEGIERVRSGGNVFYRFQSFGRAFNPEMITQKAIRTWVETKLPELQARGKLTRDEVAQALGTSVEQAQSLFDDLDRSGMQDYDGLYKF